MTEILMFLLYTILCFTISSSIHELGHILTGLAQGFKFYLFIAGPFAFKRSESGKIIFYIEKNVSLWGGLGATIPVNEDKDNFKKFARVLLGGPMASLLFGAICLPFGIYSKSLFLLLLGAMPISMGAASLIPARNGAFYTDGGRWLRMHKSEETKAVEMAIWNLTQNAIIQGSYAKANFDEIMVLINQEDMRIKYLGHYYAYYFHKDNGDILNSEKARTELASLKEKVPKQMVSMFSID